MEGDLVSENSVNFGSNEELFLGNASTDFTSPCVSILTKDSIYSDISDDEAFDIPCSQLEKR